VGLGLRWGCGCGLIMSNARGSKGGGEALAADAMCSCSSAAAHPHPADKTHMQGSQQNIKPSPTAPTRSLKPQTPPQKTQPPNQRPLTFPQDPAPGFSSISGVSSTLMPAASASARPQVQSLHALRPALPTSQSSAAAAAAAGSGGLVGVWARCGFVLGRWSAWNSIMTHAAEHIPQHTHTNTLINQHPNQPTPPHTHTWRRPRLVLLCEQLLLIHQLLITIVIIHRQLPCGCCCCGCCCCCCCGLGGGLLESGFGADAVAGDRGCDLSFVGVAICKGGRALCERGVGSRAKGVWGSRAVSAVCTRGMEGGGAAQRAAANNPPSSLWPPCSRQSRSAAERS